MERLKRPWVLPFIILAIASLAGALMPAPESVVKGEPANKGDIAWMLTASALVLLMTPGLSFFYGGMVHRKNVISTMLQSFVAMGVVSLLWVTVGFSLAFGESIGGVIGNPMTFLMFRGVGVDTHPDLSPTIPLALFALFQLKFAIITPALITGAFAERVRFTSYLLFISLFSLVIYPVLAHMTWHPQGLLRQMGVLDFAGGTVVHMSAGLAALVGAMVLGPRMVHRERKPHEPAHIPYVLLGTGMLWFGWFGFNAGSALEASGLAVKAFLTTNTASAAAMLGWMFFDASMGRKPTAVGAAIGAVVGLVAITPAAGFVSVGASMAIGLVAAVISNLAVHWRSKTEIDDTLDVFPCHGIGGITGMIATAVFAENGGVVTGQWRLLGVHVLATIGVAAYVLIWSWALYRVTNFVLPLRVTQDQEKEGLDRSQHGEALLVS